MGLFDKIKDNAKTISMKALEATREYEEDYPQDNQAAPAPTTALENQTVTEPPVQVVEQPVAQPATPPLLEEPEFLDENPESQPEPKTQPEDTPAEEKPEAKEDKPAARKSKVTEVSKEEHEKAEEEKRQEKAKQAAKERLAKSYVPSYKKQAAEKSEEVKVETKSSDKPATKAKATAATAESKSGPGIIDITPGPIVDPTKKAIYARERAALNALASQRKLNGVAPLYTAVHMNFKTRVFINRIEYSGSFGKTVIPLEQVAWVKLRHGGTGVIIETTEGKRVVMVVKASDRLAFADAVIKVQAMQPKKGKFRDTKTVRIDELEKFSEGIDELEKLAKLFDKGILSQEEFDLKKKQILGI